MISQIRNHNISVGRVVGKRALESGSPWLRPRSLGFKGELQRQGCVNVASFVPAQGRKTSQCPLLPQGGSSDPRRYSLPPFTP